MDWQDVICLSAVGAAVAYLGWRAWSFFRGVNKTGCAGGCGCSKAAKPTGGLVGEDELTARLRG